MWSGLMLNLLLGPLIDEEVLLIKIRGKVWRDAINLKSQSCKLGRSQSLVVWEALILGASNRSVYCVNKEIMKGLCMNQRSVAWTLAV